MIDFAALFKLTYGLYVVCSGDNESGNGYISNTVFQVTSEPPKFASCCNKQNHTSGFIESSGFFSVSVLDRDVEADIIGRFGYRTGHDLNKLEGLDIIYGETGTPIVLNSCLAYLECSVVNRFDTGTHWIYIGELVNARIVDNDSEPLTYDYYRNVKKLVAPKNAPTYIDKSKLE